MSLEDEKPQLPRGRPKGSGTKTRKKTASAAPAPDPAGDRSVDPGSSSAASTSITRNDVSREALATWATLRDVVQAELASVKKGEKELTASLVTSVNGFVKLSADITSNPDVFGRKVDDPWSSMSLPEFDDSEDDDPAVNGDDYTDERHEPLGRL